MGSPPPQWKNCHKSNRVRSARLGGKSAPHGPPATTHGARERLCAGRGDAGQESHPLPCWSHTSPAAPQTHQGAAELSKGQSETENLQTLRGYFSTHLCDYTVKPQLQVILKELAGKKKPTKQHFCKSQAEYKEKKL